MRCAGRIHPGVLIASQRIRPTPRYELPGGPTQLGHTRRRSRGVACASLPGPSGCATPGLLWEPWVPVGSLCSRGLISALWHGILPPRRRCRAEWRLAAIPSAPVGRGRPRV